MSKKINKAAFSLFALAILLSATIYLFKNKILHYVIDKKIDELEQQYNLSIKYGSINMVGINEIDLKDISVVPNKRDTFLILQSMNVDLDPLSLIEGRVSIFKIDIEKLTLNFIKQDSISNYDFLFKKKKDKKVIESNLTYEKKIDKIFKIIFDFLPKNGKITNMNICQKRDQSIIKIEMPQLLIKEHHFSGNISINDNDENNFWQTNGYINSNQKRIEASISPIFPTKHIAIPYINRYYKAGISFDKISFEFEATHDFNTEHIKGEASINGLHIFHKRLSPDTISIDKGVINYNVNIGKNYIELDSTSSITINQLEINPYLKAEKNKKWHILATLNKQYFPAQNLFNSLPKALFSSLQGIKVTGDLKYNFLLDIDFNNIDSTKFHSILRSKNLHINDYGNSCLTKMNNEFEYTAYDDGKPVRTFSIGPSNPNYRSIDEISPILKNAIIQSEDNGFPYHNGFLPGAIQEALIHDIKVKRFARGGSTISMQLVKNVFLNRNKNIARKLEEALLVWLIENQHITSKRRMYEVYLNLIEWAPMVYGAKEASYFYFNKEPNKLTLNESIFLASLIPRPKQYKSFFNNDGTLKKNKGYFKLIAHRLMKMGIITEEEATAFPSVNITGEAKNHIKINMIANDSLLIYQNDSIQ